MTTYSDGNTSDQLRRQWKKHWNFIILLILVTLFLCKNPQAQAEKSASGGTEPHKYSDPVAPIHALVWRDKANLLQIQLGAAAHHAIQDSEYNELKLKRSSGKTMDLKLVGKLRTDKPEYFQNVNPIAVDSKAGEKLEITGKILFCNLTKNYCVNKDLAIKFDSL